ncbi:hypothetical protein XF35_40330 [Streptomyces platensis subsp. clarensis]|uniref:Uncharacterized protein n=1 Tax=Streptomyces showdoensis TaxID=68268 RepID=A0A2P2GMM9_STREW|nr:hypothetical protein [Streptomyces showdoensis]KKZ72109.1 hypothetical protein VO63_20250 [Streptomyces showdoensis]MCW7991287.1 hypothetical protein [Streptomyces platensis subsp. clarensis]
MSQYLNALLTLVDEAEHRPLRAEEAGVLRDQLRSLEANRRQVSGLLASLQSARQEVELLAKVAGPLIGGGGEDALRAVLAAARPDPARRQGGAARRSTGRP